MADFCLVTPGIQDGSTVYPVELLFAAGRVDASAALERAASLTRVAPG
jgi:hypothetical protein